MLYEVITYNGKEGYGYILDYQVLDTIGEWFHRKNAGLLYYKPKGGLVSNKEIEVKIREYAIILNNSDSITFSGSYNFV